MDVTIHYHLVKRYDLDGYSVKNLGDAVSRDACRAATRELADNARSWGMPVTRLRDRDGYRIKPPYAPAFTATVEPCCDMDCEVSS